MKIRLTGTDSEIRATLATLKAVLPVRSVSKSYPCRDSVCGEVSVYVETELPHVSLKHLRD